MADNHRIDDLRRRVQKDPSSIAFAQLAEECRRAGEFQEAVDVCRAGLELHPGYLSARVTLGRALAGLNQIDAAQAELATVLKGAPDNLAAVRGMAEILHRRGLIPEALAQYGTALSLSRNDTELERIIGDLSREIGTAKKPDKSDPAAGSGSSRAASRGDALTFEEAARELAKSPPAAQHAESAAAAPAPAPVPSPSAAARPAVMVRLEGPTVEQVRTLAALEQWLNAIHVARAGRRA